MQEQLIHRSMQVYEAKQAGFVVLDNLVALNKNGLY